FHLFAPPITCRLRRSLNTDTPLPPEVPAGQNPPDGAIIDYYLASAASVPVTLEIADRAGKILRHFSSDDPPPPFEEKELKVPTYRVRPPRNWSNAAGMNRFVWDLHL